MRIYIKNKGTSFSLPLPAWLFDLVPSSVLNAVIKHRSNNGESPGNDDVDGDFPKSKNESISASIDFDAIKKSIHILSQYKGLNILEIRNNSGDEIIIQS